MSKAKDRKRRAERKLKRMAILHSEDKLSQLPEQQQSRRLSLEQWRAALSKAS
jgi:hypothetical protein